MSNKSLYLCLDVGGTKILGVVFDSEMRIMYEDKFSTHVEKGIHEVEVTMFSCVEKLIDKCRDIGVIKAIGIGIPGIIDHSKGEIIFSPNIPWQNYSLKKNLEKRFELPVYIGNDVNLGLLGECKYGIGKNYSYAIGIFVGTGVGGAICIDGKLYVGAKSWAGEFGHIVLDPNGPVCGCGMRGCLEAYAGKAGITRFVKNKIENGYETLLWETIQKEGTIKGNALKHAIMQNDKVAMELLEYVADHISRAAGILVSILNPDSIILGGGIVEASKANIVDKVKEKIGIYAIGHMVQNLQISKARLGDYAAVYGAMAMLDEFGEVK